MRTLDDSTLVAYVDGELDPKICIEVESVLAHDEQLQGKARHLRESTALVRSAFNHVMHGPMPKLQRPQPDNIVALDRPSTTRTRLSAAPIAIAASIVALIAGMLIGQSFDSHRSSATTQLASISAGDEVEIQDVFQQVLEKELSGMTLDWANPASGNHGSTTAVRTFQTRNGVYCREFIQENLINGLSEEERGIACRQDGIWRTQMHYADDDTQT